MLFRKRQLCKILTGKPPFWGENARRTIADVQNSKNSNKKNLKLSHQYILCTDTNSKCCIILYMLYIINYGIQPFTILD